MKTLALAAALLFAAPTLAGPGGNNHNRTDNGADAFRDVVVACMVAMLEAGATDPVALVDPCVDATQAVWAAVYPPLCTSPFCP